MSEIKKTPRSRVKRKHYRGNYDFDTVAAILDAGFICHVGYNIEGKPYVTPTSYWRDGESVYCQRQPHVTRAIEGHRRVLHRHMWTAW